MEVAQPVDVVKISGETESFVTIIKHMRFRRDPTNKDVYVLRGGLTELERKIVEDLIESRDGKLVTRKPEAVIERLLQNGQLLFDMMFAVRVYAAVVREDPILLKRSTAIYTYVLEALERYGNKIRKVYPKAVKKGSMWEVKMDLEEKGYYLKSFKTLIDNKTTNVALSVLVWENKRNPKDRYVVLTGRSMFNIDSMSFAPYDIVFREGDVKGMSKEELWHLYNLAFVLEQVGLGMGELKEEYSSGDDNLKLRALLGNYLKYDIMKDEVVEKVMVTVVSEAKGSSYPLVNFSFDTEEEARNWLKKELIPKWEAMIQRFREDMQSQFQEATYDNSMYM